MLGGPSFFHSLAYLVAPVVAVVVVLRVQLAADGRHKLRGFYLNFPQFIKKPGLESGKLIMVCII